MISMKAKLVIRDLKGVLDTGYFLERNKEDIAYILKLVEQLNKRNTRQFKLLNKKDKEIEKLKKEIERLKEEV